MRKIIALFALMDFCLMGAAKGLAPPGPDLAKETTTVAINDGVQFDQVTLDQFAITDMPQSFVYLQICARDAVLISEYRDILITSFFVVTPQYNYTLKLSKPFTGIWQSFY